MKRTVATICSTAILFAGCATSSKDIATSYVTPLQYQAYDCNQITAEIQRIQMRVSELGGRLDQAASNDKAIMGVGLILFWPALFFVGGTKQQEAEYGRLKGEYEALQQASVSKRCMTANSAPLVPVPSQTATAVSVGDVEKRIALLRELKEKGILSDVEFSAKQKELFEQLASGTLNAPNVSPRLAQ